jgi:chaperonin GroES
MGKQIHLVGYNVLIEREELEKTSSSGLVIPETAERKEKLACGKVVQKGPGFLIPNVIGQESDLDVVLERETVKHKFIPLDVQERDIVYYNKEAGEEIRLNGKDYVIVPYPAIRLFIRSI